MNIMLHGGPNCDSQASHEITKWHNNKTAAVSVTFDDGYYSQATDGVAFLNARKIRGTFFTTVTQIDTSSRPSWQMWQDAVDEGHEIGSHTLTHPYLTSLSATAFREELSESQAAINFNIPTQSCSTLAYPYGNFNQDVMYMTSEYYIAARKTGDPLNYYPGEPLNPIDFFKIGSLSFDNSTHSEVMDGTLPVLPHTEITACYDRLRALGDDIGDLVAADVLK